ncbi:MAG: excinuclease ABC subunit UvrB [Bdellovibrionales bacterium]
MPTKIERRRAKKANFQLTSDFTPSGDQPQAIKELVESYKAGVKEQTLLGVTGSGKTFTMANTIQALGLPSIIIAPNKTLAAQMYVEFRELFPNNAVEYFVSYYDYYQPEAYMPTSDTYIEKDSSINEQLDRMRHSATRSLLERDDVIIISSVSCIYGLGSPESYEDLVLKISVNQEVARDQFLRDLVFIQYERKDIDFSRACFRVRGDVVEIFPPYEDSHVVRVEFFGEFIDRITRVDPISGEKLGEFEEMNIYPASHYVNTTDRLNKAIDNIKDELRERLQDLKENMNLLEAQRLEQRTYYDIEMMEQLGYCQGIENYSRHLTGRLPGDPPPTLLEYFPEDFLMIIDESHIGVPQVGGMYRGDRSRKSRLVEHGFRLPSALDNRPLNFNEFKDLQDRVMYVSATPGEYEFEASEGLVVEQVIRPTGLLDPIVEVRSAKFQVDDILKEIRIRVKKKERVLITTLTKRSSEDLTEYFDGHGVKVKYLHSDIKTFERTQIIRDLRLGVFDVLIGINLLREGLDIPEVSLVAITDADKEGFLRSTRSLIQTMGRAARNVEGRVILYAERETDSMKTAMEETSRRRIMQEEYNKEHGITPQTIKKNIQDGLHEIFEADYSTVPLEEQSEDFNKYKDLIEKPSKFNREIEKLRKKMRAAADELEFEEAAGFRDEIKRLEMMELAYREGGG